jgi:RNA polymerase sigma-70 factor, ECF subfamily
MSGEISGNNKNTAQAGVAGPGAMAEAAKLAAALNGDQQAFTDLTEPYRRQLLAHCYRMLGSLEDAEDQVQETMLRAWRRLETYEGRATLRAWLYKIATNACLDLLSRRLKRSLPAALSAAADPLKPPDPPVFEPVWIEPYPDELLSPIEAGPEARYEWRESISFAFLVALQELPPRQRCALILGDVLDWQAVEIAGALDITVSAVNSLLHRARLTLKQRYPGAGAEGLSVDTTSIASNLRQEQLLHQYVTFWETADIDGIVSMLTEEATFPMPPLPSWYQGREAIKSFIQATSLAGQAAGRWRLLSIHANGLPGFAFYVRDETTGTYTPFALQILRFAGELLDEVITFGMPGLFNFFGLPELLN